MLTLEARRTITVDITKNTKPHITTHGGGDRDTYKIRGPGLC